MESKILTVQANKTIEKQLRLRVKFYFKPNSFVRVIKSRKMRLSGHVTGMGRGKGGYKVLVGKPEGKRPLGLPNIGWVDNIRTDLQEV